VYCSSDDAFTGGPVAHHGGGGGGTVIDTAGATDAITNATSVANARGI
jgi:hypothetical protein